MKHATDENSIVYIVDDDASLRAALKSLLGSVGLRVQVFAAASDFLAIKAEEVPSCLVLDVRMPGHSGLDFQAALNRSNINIPIVFITGHGDVPMSVRAMKAGAIEFLTKPFRDQDLIDAVQSGLERDRARRQSEAAAAGLRACYDQLTAREQEVMALVTTGLMNKQVAGELGVSEITVKVHRGNLMRKMGARSLADLVRMADQIGLRRAGT